MKELPKVVAGTEVGKSVPVEILRDGKRIKLVVTLGELELAEKTTLAKPSSNKDSKIFPKIGFELEKLNSKNKRKFKLDNFSNGVVIKSVKENTLAYNAGLREGMIILRVG